MTRHGERVRDGRVVLRHTGNKGSTCQLSVSAQIARLIPDDSVFRAELVDEGVLFRFVGTKGQEDDVDVPEWARR